MSEFSLDILQRISDAQNVFWAGDCSPNYRYTRSADLYDPRKDFRLPHSFHQIFDAVFLVERDLGTFKQWPIILDEALRLVRSGGIIIVRTTQTYFLSIFELANYLEKWVGGNIMLESQVISGGEFTVSFSVHKNNAKREIKSLAFCVISDGRNRENIRRFVESIQRIDGIDSIQSKIYVCGPQKIAEDISDLADAFTVLPEPAKFPNKAWVTRKKNTLVEASAAAGMDYIAVVHDRYNFPADFLKCLFDFGADFDILCAKQTTSNGDPIPYWTALGKPLNWTPPLWLEDGDYHPHVYINGGAIIARTEVLIETRWSEMLFWAQAEDVELTQRLKDRGVTPRLSTKVKLITAAMRPDFLRGFIRLPWMENAYPLVERASVDPANGSDWNATRFYDIGTVVDLNSDVPQDRAWHHAIMLERSWTKVDGGIEWTLAEPAIISTRLRSPSGDLRLIMTGIDGHPPAIGGVYINGVEVKCLSLPEAESVQATLPSDTFLSTGVIHICVRPKAGMPVRLRAIGLQHAPLAVGKLIHTNKSHWQSFLQFSRGWHDREDWGVWASANEAELKVQTELCDGQAASLFLTLQAFAPTNDPHQVVGISINDFPIQSVVFSRDVLQKTISFPIPPDFVANGLFTLKFKAMRVMSPREAGISSDERPLGFGLLNLLIVLQ